MTAQRARVVYRGTVQGVGFRFTARRLAAGRELSGYVRNLPDGTVELVAEGARPEVDLLLEDVASAMSGCVSSAEVEWSAARGEPAGFSIRF